MRVRSVFACGAVAPLLIAAVQPTRLQPSSPWVVDYAENSCRLIRTFGEGRTLTKLGLESEAPDDADMLATGRPLSTSADKVPARFVPVGVETFDGKAVKTVGDKQPAILWGHVEMIPDEMRKRLDDEDKRYRDAGVRPPPVSLAEQASRKLQRDEFAAGATELEIQTDRHRPVILETGSMGEPMKALEKCGRDSLKDWGVDPQLDAQIVRPVWAVNPTKWLFPSDYPVDMLRRGEQSAVSVRLLVDASGKITKCTSLSHYDEPEFNRITCDRIISRARLEPAELADGTKVPSYFVQRVVFQLVP